MDHIQELYGRESIMFSDEEDYMRLRKIIHSVVEPHRLAEQDDLISSVIALHLGSLNEQAEVPLYQTFKRLSTDLCLALFLGMDLKDLKENSEKYTALATTHWHGIVSIPLKVQVPVFGRSTFRAAMDAKDKLLEEIHARMDKADRSTLLCAMTEAGFKTKEEAACHILLFVSALVPKALSSLLTSFCLELALDKHQWMHDKALEDEEFLGHLLLEIQRRWPPFLGGRKITTERLCISGFTVPEGHSLMYTTFTANMDAKVFPEPEILKPDRWSGVNAGNEDRVWTFGGGPRGCVGKLLSQTLMKQAALYLLKRYNWTHPTQQSFSVKWLPVSRPKESVVCNFELRDELL
jgi:cytochrome P450